MIRCALFLALVLAPVTLPRAEAVEIWKYAFVARTDEPVAGHGAAIFKPDGADR